MVIKTLYDLPAEFEYERRNLSLHPQAYKPLNLISPEDFNLTCLVNIFFTPVRLQS